MDRYLVMGLSGGRQELSADVSRFDPSFFSIDLPAQLDTHQRVLEEEATRFGLVGADPTHDGSKVDLRVGRVVAQHGEDLRTLAQVVVGVPERNDLGAVGAQRPGYVTAEEARTSRHHHARTVDDEHSRGDYAWPARTSAS